MEIGTKLLGKCGMKTGESDDSLQFYKTILDALACEVDHCIILDILIHFPQFLLDIYKTNSAFHNYTHHHYQ